jgi:hypothetical protein
LNRISSITVSYDFPFWYDWYFNLVPS